MTPVIDGHADVFSKCIEDTLDYVDDADRFQASRGHLARGGVQIQIASIFCPKERSGLEATHYALRVVGAAWESAARLGSRVVLDARGLEDALADAGPSYMLGMEGASPLRGDPDMLRLFVGLGLSVLGLTHNHDNECGDGCFARRPRGLTPAGSVLATMAEDLGVVLDTAHLNPAAFDQLMALARWPVVYTHGGSRALRDVPRNLTDAQARAIADSGGVIGIDFFPGHVGRDGETGDIADVIAHVDHFVALVGSDHVGFGGDFDGIPTLLRGVADAGIYPELLDRLRGLGYSEAACADIAGRNFARVLRAAMARRPQRA